ncbi:FG-GAP repeat domain-containing protein [Streptomyces termitum]|uniref:FG-GAP repeat domain-containing protein n=1 Tax=Streptomyces termitum TaxID=67368 RepID=UPI0033A947F1
MSTGRSTRRLRVSAVTTVLAVTLGATALTAPAHAGPVADGVRTTAAADAEPIAYPTDGRLVSAGVNGFLTTSSAGVSIFHRYAGGAEQSYGTSAVYLRSSSTTDFLITRKSTVITQRNMATDELLEVPIGTQPGDARWVGAAGDSVFTTVVTEAGTVLRRHVAGSPAVVVSGLPAGATSFTVTPGTPAHAKVTFSTVPPGGGGGGLIDLATGVFTPSAPGVGRTAVSDAYTAWPMGWGDGGPTQVFFSNRATGEVREVPVPSRFATSNLQVGLVGDWVVYGKKGARGSYYTGDGSVTAYNVVTGTTVRMLDHAYAFAPAPDGSLYARGGVVGQGEGLYRLATTGDGTLKSELIATTGEPTEVVITGSTAPPAVLDLDRTKDAVFTWDFSREVGGMKLTLRHVRTGETRFLTVPGSWYRPVAFAWDDPEWRWGMNVPNGDFTWELVGGPYDGVGPEITARGTFKVVRGVRPHDFNDNGSPDLLTRDSSGYLWRTDLHYTPATGGWHGVDEAGAKTPLGANVGAYDRMEAAGDLGGTPVGDLLARDRAGVLWLYQGTGNGGFTSRTQADTGWQVYDTMTSGSDLTGDGRVDALAVDKSGVVWLYAGTGNVTKPFLPRTKLGTGWGVYNDITAVGDIAGGTGGDLVGRDRNGVLWLHLGNGDGTFANRVQIGGGWGESRALIAGDADGDGRPDLMSLGADWRASQLYRSTGNWRTPFLAPEAMNLPQVDANKSDLVF